MKRNINKPAEVVEIIEDYNESLPHEKNCIPALSPSQLRKSHPPAVPVVTVRDGQVVASSLDVAAYFGKAHKNVIQSIELLMADPAANGLIFQPIEYIDTRGRAKPAYAMTRDGFTLLVMGFTGQKATAFKLAYIREFNRMEAALKAAPALVPLPPQ